MPWFENLEEELAASAATTNESRPQDSLAGSTGINAKPEIADSAVETENLEDIQPKTKQKTPTEIFAEKVTIAGLEEAYNAKLKADRIMFRFTLAVAGCLMICQSIGIAKQHMGQTTIFLDKDLADRAPFPGITICIPPTVHDIPFPLISALPKRDADFMTKHNLTIGDVNDFVKQGFSLNIKTSDVDTPLYLITKKLVNTAFQSTSANDQKSSLETVTKSSCRDVLSNCEFEGWRFDCCDEAQFLPLMALPCFRIDPANADKRETNKTPMAKTKDPYRLENLGLTIDVSTNWTNGVYQSGDASDGYHLFVGTLPTFFDVPIPIPAGMNAVVTLAPAKKETKITQCFSPGHVPRLQYFDTYDADGVSCMAEAMIKALHNHTGCLMPVLSFFPTNQTCSFEQFVTIGMFINGEAFSNDLRQHQDNEFRSFKLMFSDQSPCKPVCSRWIHPVLSASYGSIQYRDKGEEKRQLTNRSWSRIRIISPDAWYTSRREIEVAASYMAVCDIGGMMGVWAGFSMITFAQIFFYSANIGWSKWRKRRKALVTPLIK